MIVARTKTGSLVEIRTMVLSDMDSLMKLKDAESWMQPQQEDLYISS